MKRWAVAGVILLVSIGGCRKASDEESAAPQREKRARPAVAARPARNGQQRILAAPAPAEEQNPPPRIKAAPEEPEAPESSAPPAYVPPPAPGNGPTPPAAPPAPAAPTYPPASRRLTKTEVEDRLKQHIQPVFIDVSLTDYGNGQYAGTAKDTAYTDIPIRVSVDYSNVIRYQIGIPDAFARGIITPDNRHTNTMHIKP